MNLPTSVSGVFPRLAVRADHFPARTETGIGALMPWADRLWFITYVAHKSPSGGGTGLFFIDDAMNLTKHEASVVGTYANRMIHHETSQLIIGPHIIDADGNVRTVDALVNTRLTGVCRHLEDPQHRVHVLGMEGEFFDLDLRTLEATQRFDLTKELGTSGPSAAHFKDVHCDHGRVVVCNNSYYARDFATGRGSEDGRLAEWNGASWRVLDRTQYNTVDGRVAGELGRAIYAFGQDEASALMRVYLPATGWTTYRLPKGTHTQDHAWTTEWPRLREVESERWLLDASGIFYEVPAMTYGDRVWGVKPICSHLRIVGDFCSWNGMLVMAGDQTTPINDTNATVGQPQANLWFGKTDDLWSWGKPTGWGGPWWETNVGAGEPSDPFLMTGFEHKCLHLSHDAKVSVKVDVELDVRGDGRFLKSMSIDVPPRELKTHVFPTGLSAHWLRLRASAECVATAQLHYT